MRKRAAKQKSSGAAKARGAISKEKPTHTPDPDAKPGEYVVRVRNWSDGSGDTHDMTLKKYIQAMRDETEYMTFARAKRVREAEEKAKHSAMQSARAKKLRKKVTKEALLEFKKMREGKYGNARGWKSAACLHFEIDRKTLAKRIRD